MRRMINRIREWGRSPATDADVIMAAVLVPIVSLVVVALVLAVIQ